MKRLIIGNVILILIFTNFSVFPQKSTLQKIPKDTSYTLYSAAKKMYKKFPQAILMKDILPNNVKVKKNIVYKKNGKRKLLLNIYYPSKFQKKVYPAILMIHGGGWSSGDISLIIPMAERIAAKGYITIAAEYRLSPESLYPAAIYDLKDAIIWMRENSKQFHIDTAKIAVYGCSAGGQLSALIGATNNNEKFEDKKNILKISSTVQAVIDVDGVVDFYGKNSEEIIKPSGKPTAAQKWFGVSAKDNPEIWKDASAISHVSKYYPPILFINSAVPRFHAGQDEMAQLLKKYKIYYEIHSIPQTIHTFWLFSPWFEQTFNLTVNFLQKVFYKNK